MTIEILGTGCSRCTSLYELVRQALAETGQEAEVAKVEDIGRIMAYEILMTPGLVIDGEVKAAGRVPKLDEIKSLILAAKGA